MLSMIYSYLTNSDYYLYHALNYDVHTDFIKPKQYIALSDWDFVFSFCNKFGIAPPLLLTLQLLKPNSKGKV